MSRKTRKKYKLPVVEIYWVDSKSARGWRAKKHMKKCDTRMRTVGQLVAEDHKSYTVTASQCLESGYVDCPIKIPKVAVIEIWEIEYDT